MYGTSIRRWVFVIAVVCWSTLAASQERLKFSLSDQLLITLPARAGDVEGPFIIDLGAGVDVISDQTAQQLKAEPAGYYTGFHMGGERMDTKLARIPSLQLGTIVAHPKVVGLFPDLDQWGFKGMVSAKFFAQHPATFDFVHKEVTLETEQSLASRSRSASSVALNTAEDRGITLDLFADFDLGKGQRGECLMDTGSAGISVNERYMAGLGIDRNAVEKRQVKSIAGAERTLYHTRLPSIALATAPAVNLHNAEVNFSDIIYDCVIGNRFWLDKVVTLDLPHRRLLVSVGEKAH